MTRPHPATRVPAPAFFVCSAFFHYFGPSLAVLLFAHVGVLGVAWLRIASAAAVFALWRRPWMVLRRAGRDVLLVLCGLGVVLGVMNSLFYLAIDQLPLSTVGAIEFLGTTVLAAAGVRTRRNLLALVLAVAGVAALTEVRFAGRPLGFLLAFANCVCFMLYVVLAHRVASSGCPPTDRDGDGHGHGHGHGHAYPSSIDQLATAMLIAAVVATPVGIGQAAVAVTHPLWLAWGVGVGVCSSVIPYVSDQLAMARLPRATFALMLALLPATAAAMGLVVLAQVPTGQDLLGIGLVVLAVALHQEAPHEGRRSGGGSERSRCGRPGNGLHDQDGSA